MEPSVGVGILEQAVFVLVVHSHLLVFFFLLAHEIVGVDEVVAGVVRWVYKNAVFDTNRRSLLRHISAEKGLK